MSSASASLRLTVRRRQCHIGLLSPSNICASSRPFVTTHVLREDEKKPEAVLPDEKSLEKAPAPPKEGGSTELESKKKGLKALQQWERLVAREPVFGSMAKVLRQQLARKTVTPEHQNILDRSRFRPRPPKQKPGFFNQGKKSHEALEDPEFEEDDVSSIAHGELEQHREFREYARIAAWEMPMLSAMAKPFVPPAATQILRFRYTSYMGEDHPAEKKVVVEFCPADIPGLSPVQLLKLKKLVGVRYNPETDIVKMSSEMFETQAQNKRYLGDLVDTLVKEAKDPKDTFEDVPLDLRHHQIKVKPKFPKEWYLSEKRKAELAAERAQTLRLEQERELQGTVIDGVARIEAATTASRRAPLEESGMPVMAGVGKGKKVAIKR